MAFPSLHSSFEQDRGAQAAYRLFELCFEHVGGSTTPIAAFLVSLYNNEYASPDAYLLCRRLDDEHFEDIIETMRWFRDVRGRPDIHQIFGASGDPVMRDLMERFGLGPSSA